MSLKRRMHSSTLAAFIFPNYITNDCLRTCFIMYRSPRCSSPKMYANLLFLALTVTLIRPGQLLDSSSDLDTTQRSANLPFDFQFRGTSNSTHESISHVSLPSTTTPTATVPRNAFSDTFGVNISIPLQINEGAPPRGNSSLVRPTSRTVSGFSRNSEGLNGVPEKLLVCLLVEKNLFGTLYFDYGKSAAAIALGVQYANTIVLPPHLQLETLYKDIGYSCEKANHAVAHFLRVLENGYRCDVVVGPGINVIALICSSFFFQLYDLTVNVN